MSYAELLKDPRWQKKRLQILERDNWTCQMCGDTKATLTVHHKSYHYKDGEFADIWDYEDPYLATLCVSCHDLEEKLLKEHRDSCYFTLRECCEDAATMGNVIASAKLLSLNLGRRVNRDDIFYTFAAIETLLNGGVNTKDLAEKIAATFSREK